LNLSLVLIATAKVNKLVVVAASAYADFAVD